MEEGKLSLEQKVVDFIPEFGTHGKEVVTIRQLVTCESDLFPTVQRLLSALPSCLAGRKHSV